MSLAGTTSERVAKLKGGAICYRPDGPASAPAVILIAGLGMQLIEWPQALVDGLARDFRVIRMDNRDSGLSGRCGEAHDAVPEGFSWQGSAPGLAVYDLCDMADDVLALANHLGLGSFGCVGFSMGGMIAQLLSARAPERVTRLVSLSSGGGDTALTTEETSLRMMERFFLPFATRAAEIGAILDSNSFFSLGMMPRESRENIALAEALVERAEDRGGYLRQALAITTTAPWRERLEGAELPALFVHGEGDPCIDAASARRLAETMPGGRFCLLPGVGHWMDEEACDLAVDWMRRGLSDRD